MDDILIDANTLNAKTVQRDNETLDEEYLKEFQERMTKFLESQIDAQNNHEVKIAQTPLQIELQAQNYFAINKRKNFLAQEELRAAISNYITDDNQQALVVYGKSGRGKSALMAKAIQEAENTLQTKVLYRFVGATPNASSSKEILTSMFEELGINLSSEKKEETFIEFSKRIYSEILKIKENIVIFIDAIDQTQNSDQFIWLPNNLPSNVKIVISALEDEKYADDSKYFQALKTKTDTLHLIPDFDEPSRLLHALLEQEDRTIQEDQEKYFLQQYEKVKSPLYISIAAQSLKHCKSSNSSPRLADTQQGVIEEFINSLSTVFHHDKKFVNKVLGFIYASRDGLSESELLQLLEMDKEFVKLMADEKFHKNHTLELPLIHWSRLQTQLKPFLNSKTQNDEELIYFFHREFEDVIKNMPTQKEEHEAVIKSTQELITQALHLPFHDEKKAFQKRRWFNLYGTLIAEYEFRYNAKEEQRKFFEFIVTDLKGKYKEEIEFKEGYEKIYNDMVDMWLEDFIFEIYTFGHKCLSLGQLDRSIIYLNLSKTFSQKIEHENYRVRKQEIKGRSFELLKVAYNSNKQFDELIELIHEDFELIQEKYKENPESISSIYQSSLLALVKSYAKTNQTEKEKELLNNSLAMHVELCKENPLVWIKHYVTLIHHIYFRYYRNPMQLQQSSTTAAQLDNLVMLLENLCKEGSEDCAEMYRSFLSTSLRAHTDKDKLEYKIQINEKHLNLAQRLYQQNSDKWAEYYIKSLNDLLHLYTHQENIKFFELLDTLYEISKKHYGKDDSRTMEISKWINEVKIYRKPSFIEKFLKKNLLLLPLVLVIDFMFGLTNINYGLTDNTVNNNSSSNSKKTTINKKYGLYVSTDKHATIKILNIKPKYKNGLKLKSGKYHLYISKQGFETQKFWTEIKDKDLYISKKLKKKIPSMPIKKVSKIKSKTTSYIQKIEVPQNATLNKDKKEWTCNIGYMRIRNTCKKVI